MGLFGRKDATPAFGSETIKAASGSAAQVGQFFTYTVGATEELVTQLPTIQRGVQMMTAVAGSLGFKHYTLQWTGEEYEKIYLELERWMIQPDPKVTRNFLISNTTTDLIMRGRAFWYVTSRSQATGRPLSFTWLPAAMVNTLDQTGPQWFGPSTEITFNGMELDPREVVQFLSGTQGLIYTGATAMKTALRLQSAAERFAVNEIAAGYLQQRPSSEPMAKEDLQELAQGWANARRVSAVGALNSEVEWHEFDSDPSKLQLVEGRQFQALELSRAIGVPPYLLGIGVPGSFTYQNAQQARQDLYLFSVKQYLDCIQETLSSNDILPAGRYIEFDLHDYLEVNDMSDNGVEVEDSADVRISEDSRT